MAVTHEPIPDHLQDLSKLVQSLNYEGVKTVVHTRALHCVGAVPVVKPHPFCGSEVSLSPEQTVFLSGSPAAKGV